MADAKANEAFSQDQFPLVDRHEAIPFDPPPKYGATETATTSTLLDPPIVTPLGTPDALQFGQLPVQCTCPNCHQNVISRVESSNGLLVWLLFVILLVLGCWLGCCLIPFCVKSIKDKTHYCPNCGTMLGQKKSL